jgi:hypothetical protein
VAAPRRGAIEARETRESRADGSKPAG